MVGDAFVPCAKKTFPSRLPDRVGSSSVLVVRDHVTDAGMQPDRVVADALALELDLKLDGIAEAGLWP